MRGFLCFVVLLALNYPSAFASWPTSVHPDLSVATNPDLYEGYPTALPYPNGATLVIHTQENWGACYQIITRYGELT